MVVVVSFQYQKKIFLRGLKIVSKKIAFILAMVLFAYGFTTITVEYPIATFAGLALAGLFIWIMVAGEASLDEDHYDPR